MLHLEDRGPPLDEVDFEIFEMALGTRLPIDYREFMTAWNGGVPVPDAMRIDDETIHLARLYSIGAAAPIDDLFTRRTALRRLVPAELLAIGRDDSGNLLCLGLHADAFGHVYHFRIDRSSRIRQVPPTLVSRTFSDLVASLFASPATP